MSESVSQYKLNDDGINEDFFKILWKKDEVNFGPSVNIPDTILYRYGQPVNWYFTAQDGTIKRKKKLNLFNAKIEEAFMKNILGYDVIATFIHIPRNSEDSGPIVAGENVIEFLDRDGLINFLYSGNREVNGILQRFIDPKGNKNETIKAIWSPKVCLLERYENIYYLHDHRYGLYERCLTVEGPEYYCVTAPLRGPVLAGQIQKICEAVVAHISEVTFCEKEISRIVMNFKVDSRDKIWLMYATSIRSVDHNEKVLGALLGTQRKLVNINSTVSIPQNVNLNPHRTYEKFTNRGKVKCISCRTECLETMCHPVTYKSIVNHFEHVWRLSKEMTTTVGRNNARWPPDLEVLEAAGGVGFGCIDMNYPPGELPPSKLFSSMSPQEIEECHMPPIIRYLHPKFSVERYRRTKFDPLFLLKTANLCESCYLVYAEFSTMYLRMGKDLSKVLAPDPMSLISSSMKDSTSFARPSSADWGAMKASNRTDEAMMRSMSLGSALYKQANHKGAMKKAIGLRTSDTRHQPSIPSAITQPGTSLSMFASISAAEGTSYDVSGLQNLHSIDGTALNSIEPGQSPNKQSYFQESSHGDSNIAPADASAMIAERERRFFKAVAKNPQLQDQHPLLHLISSQQKLKIADEQSGVLLSKKAAKSEGLFSSTYGKQGADKHTKFAPYRAVTPYFDGFEFKVPKSAERKKPKKLKPVDGTAPKKKKASSEAFVSTHKRFLQEALKTIDTDLAAEPMPIADKVENPRALPAAKSPYASPPKSPNFSKSASPSPSRPASSSKTSRPGSQSAKKSPTQGSASASGKVPKSSSATNMAAAPAVAGGKLSRSASKRGMEIDTTTSASNTRPTTSQTPKLKKGDSSKDFFGLAPAENPVVALVEASESPEPLSPGMLSRVKSFQTSTVSFAVGKEQVNAEDIAGPLETTTSEVDAGPSAHMDLLDREFAIESAPAGSLHEITNVELTTPPLTAPPGSMVEATEASSERLQKRDHVTPGGQLEDVGSGSLTSSMTGSVEKVPPVNMPPVGVTAGLSEVDRDSPDSAPSGSLHRDPLVGRDELDIPPMSAPPTIRDSAEAYTIDKAPSSKKSPSDSGSPESSKKHIVGSDNTGKVPVVVDSADVTPMTSPVKPAVASKPTVPGFSLAIKARADSESPDDSRPGTADNDNDVLGDLGGFNSALSSPRVTVHKSPRGKFDD